MYDPSTIFFSTHALPPMRFFCSFRHFNLCSLSAQVGLWLGQGPKQKLSCGAANMSASIGALTMRLFAALISPSVMPLPLHSSTILRHFARRRRERCGCAFTKLPLTYPDVIVERRGATPHSYRFHADSFDSIRFDDSGQAGTSTY